MALKSNGVTQVPDGLGTAGKVLKVNSAGTAGEWGTINSNDLTEGSTNLFYTDARADARAALLVDSAPGTLDTLNELAAALGDDANFSTTVTNSIATKLPLAGGTMTGDISLGDNVSLNLGDGNDASLVFDGTNTTLSTTGELILDAGTGITIDGNSVTNQHALVFSNMGSGLGGIKMSRSSGGDLRFGDRMDHAKVTAISGINKSLGFSVGGSQGDANYAAFDFSIDANASSRHPAVMGVRSPNNNALLFQGEQSDSTVVFSVDYDGNVVTSGTVDSGAISAKVHHELFTVGTISSNIVSLDLNTSSSVVTVASPAANFSLAITNALNTGNTTTGIAIIVTQGSSPFIPNALTVNGSAVTINWLGGSASAGTASKTEIFSFTVINTGGVFTALGSVSTFG